MTQVWTLPVSSDLCLEATVRAHLPCRSRELNRGAWARGAPSLCAHSGHQHTPETTAVKAGINRVLQACSGCPPAAPAQRVCALVYLNLYEPLCIRGYMDRTPICLYHPTCVRSLLSLRTCLVGMGVLRRGARTRGVHVPANTAGINRHVWTTGRLWRSSLAASGPGMWSARDRTLHSVVRVSLVASACSLAHLTNAEVPCCTAFPLARCLSYCCIPVATEGEERAQLRERHRPGVGPLTSKRETDCFADTRIPCSSRPDRARHWLSVSSSKLYRFAAGPMQIAQAFTSKPPTPTHSHVSLWGRVPRSVPSLPRLCKAMLRRLLVPLKA